MAALYLTLSGPSYTTSGDTIGRDAFWGGSTWPDMCCAVGDAVHNMRSALDHIAYAVALSRRRPPKDLERIAFVVRSAGKEFNFAVGKRMVRDVVPIGLRLCGASSRTIDGTAKTCCD